MAEKSSPGTKQTDSKNLFWFGEAKIINAYLYLPFFLLIILWFVYSYPGGDPVCEGMAECPGELPRGLLLILLDPSLHKSRHLKPV